MTLASSMTEPCGVRHFFIFAPMLFSARRVKEVTLTLNTEDSPRVAMTPRSEEAVKPSGTMTMCSPPEGSRFFNSARTR